MWCLETIVDLNRKAEEAVQKGSTIKSAFREAGIQNSDLGVLKQGFEDLNWEKRCEEVYRLRKRSA